MNISDEQNNALRELINIGVGHAASALNCLIDEPIRLTVPDLEVLSVARIKENPPVSESDRILTVLMDFQGGFNGQVALMFPAESARLLVRMLTEEQVDSSRLNELCSSTLVEVGNILLNGVMRPLSNMVASRLEYSVPSCREISIQEMFACQKMETVLIAHAKLYIDELYVEGDIVLFFELESFYSLLNAIDKEFTA